MKKLQLILLFIAPAIFGYAQKASKQISVQQVKHILSTLASDEMQGRKTFTPGIEKAADFIAKEFHKIGLKQMPGLKGYKQSFTMIKPAVKKVAATVNGNEVEAKDIIVFGTSNKIEINSSSDYKKAYIKKGSSLGREVNQLAQNKANTIVFVDTSFSKFFRRISRFKEYMFEDESNLIFVLTAGEVNTFTVDAEMDIQPVIAHNIVGVLPGKSKKNETVIFSGHYDHLGIGKPVEGDSIYNGANDDASGITGVIMAAKYFKEANNNARTLVFVAFAAEEMGGFGSQYFSKKMNPDKVVAMFNLEMIGTESKWGTNSAYITGYEETNMGKILQKNLKGTPFKFYPDPYPDQQLFYRSDNATLARLGVPAHTISTSKMDVEPNYHKLSDEVSTLDIKNMTAIIKAIITSATSIVKGTETPTRVKAEGLKN